MKNMFTLFVIAYLGFGCATIFKGSSEKVDFTSSEAQTKVYVNGQYMGKTPFEMKLQSKSSYNIEFRKDGFESKTVVLNNSIGAGWIVLDVIFGVIPIIVDAATGNWTGFDQNTVSAALEPIRTPSSK